jgi:hypothetical protein
MQRAHTGTLSAIQGNVVDVHFEDGVMPLRRKLIVGTDRRVPIEVAAHLDARTIRGSPWARPVGWPAACPSPGV